MNRKKRFPEISNSNICNYYEQCGNSNNFLVSIVIIVLLLLFVYETGSVYAALYYKINIVNKGFDEDISSVYVIDLDNVPNVYQGNYDYKLYSFDYDVIDTKKLALINGSLYAQFSNDGKAIEILHNGNEMYYDVGFFTDRCGNGVCEDHESYFDCPEDCESGMVDGYCDKMLDGICDRDCPVYLDKDCVGDTEFYCNYNSICEENENKDVCPEDCMSDEVCMILKDGYCDLDCPGIDLDCYCGDNECQAFENHDNCPNDCSLFNYSILKYEEKHKEYPYEYIIPMFILFFALLLFMFDEYKLKKLREEEKRKHGF